MEASPVYEAVWRSMDRAKIVGFIELQTNEGEHKARNEEFQDLHVIIEFNADGFVLGQVPCMISAVVAMTRGWLPQNFFDLATRPDLYLPGPPAPPALENRLYFHSARYHFHELTSNGKSFEQTVRPGSKSEQDWETELQSKLAARSPTAASKAEEEWMAELRDVISPELCQRMEIFEQENAEKSLDAEDSSEEESMPIPTDDRDVPDKYSKTLHLLREIVNEGKWPATSDARSRVIKSPGKKSNNILLTKKRALASNFPGNTISAGSFTVVNQEIWENDSVPLANTLFPELAKAVFDLEGDIAQMSQPPLPSAVGMNRQSPSSIRRSPSTHCAVNRNGELLQ